MNAITDTTATEVSNIHAALDALLSEIVKIDQGPRRAGGVYTAAELMEEAREYLLMTDHQRFAYRLSREPVREALCEAIARLGERLNEIGGLRAMHEGMRFVENSDKSDDWGRRISVLDKRWDGIGGWLA